MVNYKLNKNGIEFVRNCLNLHHVDSVNGDWKDGEFDGAIEEVEKDANFRANGVEPEFLDCNPTFHMFTCDTKTGETMFFQMTWSMFDQIKCEQGDRA